MAQVAVPVYGNIADAQVYDNVAAA